MKLFQEFKMLPSKEVCVKAIILFVCNVCVDKTRVSEACVHGAWGIRSLCVYSFQKIKLMKKLVAYLPA